MGFKRAFRKSQAALCMVMVQMFTTGMLLLSKMILSQGAYIFSLLTYRQIIASLFILPLCLFMEKGMQRKITWKAMVLIFFNGLFGITMAFGLYYFGLRDTSATFASNFLNLIPIATFILSFAFGMEKLGLETIGGRVKLIGTFLCVVGAITISLYRGKALHLWSSHAQHHAAMTNAENRDITKGSLLLLGGCISSATWFIVQVKLFEVFPSMYWATMLSCMAGCLQAAVIGVALDRRMSSWRLGLDLNLLTIVYSGILTTGVNFCLISWAVATKGPTYPSMFNPLSLIFVSILESLFMGNQLFVGSILGTILISGGLYAFLWGKSNQLRAQNRKAGELVMVPESTHSNVSITPVNVGDVTMVLDSHHDSSNLPASMIVPIADQNNSSLNVKTMENFVMVSK
ncbi:hypothetical protein AAC387_Pa08g0676 [Persea americana]